LASSSGAVKLLRRVARRVRDDRREAADTPGGRELDSDGIARQLTVEQFFRTRPRSEMIFGHVRRSGPPAVGNDRIVSQLMSALLRYRRLDPDSQACALPDVVLDPKAGLILQPALAVVTFDRLTLVRDRIWGAPNVIAEVIDDRRARWTRAHRIKWYRNYGVQECWLLDPRVRRVDVIDFYRHPSEIPHVYSAGSEFVSRVLRGFRMSVSELYDASSDDPG
jgi:Uma2 family endonuclease